MPFPHLHRLAAVANCFLWSREKPWITEGQVFQNYDKFYIVQKRTQPVWPQDHFCYIYFWGTALFHGYSIISCNPPKFSLFFSVTLCFVAHKTQGSRLSPQDESLLPDCGLRPMTSGCSEATTQEVKLVGEQHKVQVFKSKELRLRYFLPSDHNTLYFAKTEFQTVNLH